MAFAEIPIDTNFPDQEMSVQLSGVAYLLRFKYNFRADLWSMDIKLNDTTVLVAGIPLVVGVSLLKRFNDRRLPRGELFILDVINSNIDPIEFSFGNTHALVYRS